MHGLHWCLHWFLKTYLHYRYKVSPRILNPLNPLRKHFHLFLGDKTLVYSARWSIPSIPLQVILIADIKLNVKAGINKTSFNMTTVVSPAWFTISTLMDPPEPAVHSASMAAQLIFKGFSNFTGYSKHSNSLTIWKFAPESNREYWYGGSSSKLCPLMLFTTAAVGVMTWTTNASFGISCLAFLLFPFGNSCELPASGLVHSELWLCFTFLVTFGAVVTFLTTLETENVFYIFLFSFSIFIHLFFIFICFSIFRTFSEGLSCSNFILI